MKKKQQLFRKAKWKKKVQVPAAGPLTLDTTLFFIHLPQLSIMLTLHSTGGGKSVKLRICDMAFVEEAQASSIILAGLGT